MKMNKIYLLFNNVKFYMSIGMTKREPTRNDMFFGQDDINPDNVDELYNFSQVRPEKVIDIEGGVEYSNDILHFTLNGFAMKFENEIAATGELSMIGLPLRTNVNKSRRDGVELDLLYKTKKWKFENNTTYMKSRINKYVVGDISYTDVVPLLTPNFIMNNTLGYTIVKGLEIFVSSRYVDNSYLDNENTLEMPSSLIFGAGFRLGVSNNNFCLRVNNITNQLYYSGGYVYDGPNYYVQAPLNIVGTIYLEL